MKRTVFAFALAALTLAAVSDSQAAPIAPPAGVRAGASALIHVQYWRWRHYHHWCYWHPHRCHG